MAAQRGMATLLMVLILLTSLGLGMIWTARSAVQAQQFAQNHVQAVMAQEAARAVLEEDLAWLDHVAKAGYPTTQPSSCSASTTGPLYAPCWSKEADIAQTPYFTTTGLKSSPFNATGFQQLLLPAIPAQYTGTSTVTGVASNYTVYRHIRHATDLSALNYLEVQAYVVSISDPNINAFSSQIVYYPFLPASVPTHTATPLIVSGTGLNLFDTTVVCPAQNNGGSPCGTSVPGGSKVAVMNATGGNNLTLNVLSGSNYHGGTAVNGNYASAFAAMFPGMSMAALQNIYNLQKAEQLNATSVPPRTVWFPTDEIINSGTSTYGSATSPVIVVQTCPVTYLLGIPLISTCISLGANVTVHGAYYLAPGSALINLDLSLFGSTTVYGVAGFETTGISGFNSNQFIYSSAYDTASQILGLTPSTGSNTIARVPGTLRDF